MLVALSGDAGFMRTQAMSRKGKAGKELLSNLQSINVNVDSSNWRTAVRGRFTTYIAPFIQSPGAFYSDTSYHTP